LEKKLLLAVDGSKNSLYALDYVSGLFQSCPESRLVLFHVLPPVPPVYKEQILYDPLAQRAILQWKKKHQEAIEQVLKKSKEKLIQLGWKDSQVRIQAQEKRIGLARDILFEARKGDYDAVVVGRRGLSKVQEFFLGSVSNKIIQGAGELPVWIVGGKTNAPRILVAVDGSENSLRAVDHLSFMLEPCQGTELKILLLNVWPGFLTLSGPRLLPNLSAWPNSQTQYEKMTLPFLDQCEKMLISAGLSPSQIKSRIALKGADIAKAILSEAGKGGYDTIVLGRRGISKAKEFFMGSVSSKILQLAEQKAVWLVG
jgi:nucleotide-binding universal stress UspA family protein